MTSHPPGKCCYQGVKHEGTAVGQLQTIADVETYVVYPEDKSTENAVLILTDVIGHRSINVQLIADQFAANGYFVLVPDILHMDPIPLNRPEGFDIQKWLHGPPGHLPPRIDPVITQVIKEMRSNLGVKKIGAVGYCFGGKYVARFLGDVGKENGARVDVGYTAHPSFVARDEMLPVDGPLSIAAAEIDTIFPEDKRHETEAILKELSEGPKKLPYQLNLYSGVSHGFSVRGDPKDQRAKFAKEQAFIQAVSWFDYFLKGIGQP